MARVGQQQSAGRGRSKREAAQANQRISGPGGLLVRFLNTQPTELSEEARRLQTAIREVVVYMLEAPSPEMRKQPVPALRFGHAMGMLYDWYAQHPYVFDLMGLKGIAEAPLAPVFRPAAELAEKERGGAGGLRPMAGAVPCGPQGLPPGKGPGVPQCTGPAPSVAPVHSM